MASNIDITLPPDDEKASKADFRAQWLTIKTEIEALMRNANVIGQIANSTHVTMTDVRIVARKEVLRVHTSFARDIAFSRVDL